MIFGQFVALLASGAAIAQPAPPAPPPPLAIPVPVPPPIVRTSPREMRVPVTFSVRVTGGGQQLFADQMRVGSSGASFNQSSRESADAVCPMFDGQLDRSLMVNVSPIYGDENRFRVNVVWRRPLGTGCDRGQRSASVEQTVALAAGQSARIEGDAGLMVEISRR